MKELIEGLLVTNDKSSVVGAINEIKSESVIYLERSKDFAAHISNTEAHITEAERDTWNAKASASLATTSTNGLMSSVDKQKLDNMNATPVTVTNSLTSTSATDALSAYQGKVLSDSKLSVAGGTMQGQLVIQSNINYTTRQARNITYSTTEPASSDGQDGDMWVVYE